MLADLPVGEKHIHPPVGLEAFSLEGDHVKRKHVRLIESVGIFPVFGLRIFRIPGRRNLL